MELDDPTITAMLEAQALPATYRVALREHVAPLATALAALAKEADHPLLVGINGCQGSGKSTLARFLARLLETGAGLACPVLSLDDFYNTRLRRQELARQVHPLLATRGVPGTHDLALAREVLDALLDAGRRDDVALPRFDKASDDRAPTEHWPRWCGGADLVLFEGWCVGCPAQAQDSLEEPVNALERDADRDGIWRGYVNEQLKGPCRDLFTRLDTLVVLQAPSFDRVFGWRRQQEARLRGRGQAVMNDAALERFIQHYERLTRFMLAVLPPVADAVIRLDKMHRMSAHSGPLFDRAGQQS